MSDRPVKLTVLMPVFEDRAAALRLIAELAGIDHLDLYLVVVEDGSILDPVRGEDISACGLTGEVVHLARNLGHQRAIAVGLMHVARSGPSDPLIVMDCDGEDRPQAIPELLAKLRSERLDIVVAQRRRRTERLRFRLFYRVYKLVFQALTGRSIQFGNFCALGPAAVSRLAIMQEVWVHFPASMMISKLRLAAIPVDRGERYHGASGMNFVSLTLHGMRSLMVFAEDVLVRVGLFCVALACVTIALLGLAAVLKLVGFATPGWYSTASGILILMLMQAAVLTLVTLMVAGVVRSASPVSPAQIESLIARIETTRAPFFHKVEA